MNIIIRYSISFILALLASWIVFRVTFEITEYLNPSKRYDTNGHPEFVMPIGALLWSSLTSLITLISMTIFANKVLKNKVCQ